MAPIQRIRIVGQLAICLTGIFILSGRCFGQFETAAVLGTVLDPHNNPVATVNVALQNLDTGVSQSTTTDERGMYQFLEARVGRYKVVAQFPGFKRAETQEFRVEVGARQRIDLTLELGEANQTVEVHESASMLQTRRRHQSASQRTLLRFIGFAGARRPFSLWPREARIVVQREWHAQSI
jgi:hypothetical protein